MSKKAIIIISSVIVLCVCLCIACFGFFFTIGGVWLNSSVKDINADLMYPACNDAQNALDIDEYFTSDASPSTKLSAQEIFENEDCNDFDPDNNLLTLLSNGNSIDANTNNGNETALYTLTQGNKKYEFNLVKESNVWLIDSVR